MAQYRNVSGQDRDLYLPDWFGPKHVPAGETVDIDDDIAGKYSFDQPGVWEIVSAPQQPQQNDQTNDGGK